MTTFENILLKKGFKYIAGVDEVGRGSLAGPIVASAIILDPKKINQLKDRVKDSKQLTPRIRESLYLEIMNAALSVSLSFIPHHTIDKKGLSYANKKALREASMGLHIKPDYVLCDAFVIHELPVPTLGLIKGDNVSISVAAASIIAKVTRDKMMDRFDRMYPGYSFESNKGYSSKAHWSALSEHGPCPIHRLSYNGVAAGA